jgi:L-aminopeptidase/D-esterase-like protein
MNNTLTDVSGVKVGHWTDLEAATGCTVVLCPQGTVAGVDVRGTAPATRETDLLDPVCMIDEVHAVLLGGGSAYGLAAADGVMRWLEEQGRGFDVGVAKVPIVPAACLFDLAIGDAKMRPDADAGYAACDPATDAPVLQGNVGAGTGATVGKVMGFGRATKGGLGTASRKIANGVIVSALVAVNAFGEVYDPSATAGSGQRTSGGRTRSGRTIAGARKPGGAFASTVEFAASLMGQTAFRLRRANTTLAVIATNASLTKPGITKVAQMAQDGMARTIRPAHTHYDGDTIFALSVGDKQADLTLVGAIAAEVLAEAILSGVRSAESLHGIPAVRDM